MSHIFKLAPASRDFLKKSGNFYNATGKREAEPPPEHEAYFKPFPPGAYLDSDSLPHHSSDVKSCGESISDRITVVGALYLSFSGRFMKVSGFFLRKSLPELGIGGELENVAHVQYSFFC